MALSWSEIRQRALVFSKEWAHETNEDAEAKSFWDGFFNIFGISRRRVATFEHNVRKLNQKQGFIDLLWKGQILIEHKSRGKDLEKAFEQAKSYLPNLKDHELPRYILVSDFAFFHLYDLEEADETKQKTVFKLSELVNYLPLFGFMAGYEKRVFKEQDPVNVEAALRMGKLHDKLLASGYEGHELEVYLVRLLFCLFADDSHIFEKGIFLESIETRTCEDGSDLAAHLDQLFDVLNKPLDKRFKNLHETYAAFPYVNGRLFEERLPIASFDTEMRNLLLECCALDWGKISPAIFGSLFQSVMNPSERRSLGAHYTSGKNISKLINPLFLDKLWQEFEAIKTNRARLQTFHQKIASLSFLDPACGCGNFLMITYRELRLLEIEVIRALQKGQMVFNIADLVKVDVDQFYGIEYEEFPSQIAQVAMWLVDHQMNQKIAETFGEYYVRLPLKKSATIVHGNALRIDWQSLRKPQSYGLSADQVNVFRAHEPEPHYGQISISAKQINIFASSEQFEQFNPPAPAFDYILGNPPFVGSKMMTEAQRSEIKALFAAVKQNGILDYVAGWYLKAAQYMKMNPSTKAAFVSTNSITQGEQLEPLWLTLLNHHHIHLHFAHQTFKWSNEAKGNAAVFCVIIGFGLIDEPEKWLFEYEHVKAEPLKRLVQKLNPYLIEANNLIVTKRHHPLCDVPQIRFGNQPIDGGYLLLTEQEKEELERIEPLATNFIRRYVGSYEFINNVKRYCLWLKSAQPQELQAMPMVLERLKKVRDFRLSSPRLETQKLAQTPSQFAFISHNDSDYIIIPSVSSERRTYIPIGFLSKKVIASNLCLIIPNASLYHFGMLTSLMHNTWMRYTCGRLKSDYRYSNSIVYNNFPWPELPTKKQIAAIEKAAQGILETRALFPNASLAELYDPLTMPPDLVKAHYILDKTIDASYRSQPFANEAERIAFLFALYERYTLRLFAPIGGKKGKNKP